jgi:hypothetical protein
VVEPAGLTRPPRVSGEVRLLMAARLGRTRLIDNVAAIPPGSTDADVADVADVADDADDADPAVTPGASADPPLPT